MIKKRMIITLSVTAGIVLLLVFRFFLNDEKEKIYCNSVVSHIYENEIDLEKFSEYANEEYWEQTSEYKKFDSFDFNKTDNLNRFFDFYYSIGFDKSLNGKIKEVAVEITIPEQANNHLMYQLVVSDKIFEGFRTKENGDGTYLIGITGVMRNKNEEEVKELISETVIHLYIQYEDGTVEKKDMQIKKSQINFERTWEGGDSVLVDKETE